MRCGRRKIIRDVDNVRKCDGLERMEGSFESGVSGRVREIRAWFLRRMAEIKVPAIESKAERSTENVSE